MLSVKWRLSTGTAIAVVILAIFLFPSTSVRHWHNARVVAVETKGLVRQFDLIDSYDPDCILRAVEFRNPFRPLSMGRGATVRISQAPGGHIYLKDDHGREHEGRIVLFGLMANHIAAQE
jgi:hypothetical protein